MKTLYKETWIQHLYKVCSITTIVFGCGLILSVLIFPFVKGWPDVAVVFRGYLVIFAALILLVLSIRFGWIGRLERQLCRIPQHRFPLALFAAALLLRLLGILIFQVDLYGDFAQNEQKAWNLSQGLGYQAWKRAQTRIGLRDLSCFPRSFTQSREEFRLYYP